jgi:hypothetical protein
VRWTEGQIALLGTLPDEEIAARIGKTAAAVKMKRIHMGIPNAFARTRKPRLPGSAPGPMTPRDEG